MALTGDFSDSWMHALENAGYKTGKGALCAMLLRR